MKLWQCDWVPTSVVDWLCRELDERGIPGTTYTHTLLSLLHPYFCPHPVPREPSHLPKGFINFECIRSILNTGQPQKELEVLFEELEEHVHPDADFPELNILEHLKEGSRRSKKRQKRKLQQLSLSPERIWKVAALQCLLTASDEHHNLENIVEELFLRLKNSRLGTLKEKVKPDEGPQLEQDFNDEQTKTSEDSAWDSFKSDITDSCYSSNFPPLSNLTHDNEPILDETGNILNWKSLIKDKLSPKKSEACNAPSIHFRRALKDVSNTFQSLTPSENKSGEMEVSPNNVENGTLEKNPYCFIPIFREEARQLNSVANQQDAVENGRGGGVFAMLEPNIDKIIETEKEKLEEWECAGNLMPGTVNRALSVDLLGNRLYERSIGSADTTRCNSNTDFGIFQSQSEEASLATPVWGYAAKSWKDAPPESVWNTSPYIRQPCSNDSSESRPPEQLSSLLPMSIRGSEEKMVERVNEYDDLIEPKHQMKESWPPNQNWSSLALSDPKSDPIFSSAFRCSPHSAFKEGARQDCKITIPEMCNENLKNIWADHNDNITAVENIPEMGAVEGQCLSPTGINTFEPPMNMGLPEKETEERLCESFKKFGLELLWEDPSKMEKFLSDESYVAKGFGVSSPSVNIFDDLSNNHREQGLTSEEELYRMKCAHKKEIEENLLLHKIPSGPTGPYVEIRYRENSGFQAVIPNKNMQMVLEDGIESEDSLRLTPKGLPESSLEHNLTTQEEENLLTSPRTHFRPIRQDSHGSLDDIKSEEGQAILNAVNIQDPDLVFQRSGSGTLYLESDLLKGSPKKYMVYREPPAKVPGVVNPSEVVENSIFSQPKEIQAVTFVPKFKLINNEKFCQTEGPEGSIIIGESLGKELESKLLQNQIKKYDFLYKPPAEQMWEGSYPNNIKLIWEEQPQVESKEAWELELNTPTLPYPKWSTHDLNQTDWSNKPLNPQASMQEPINKRPAFKSQKEDGTLHKLEEEETLSKIKFIWHNFGDKHRGPAVSAAPHAMNISTDFQSQATPFADSWAEEQPHLEVGLQVEAPNLGSSLIIPKSPWTLGVGHPREESDFKSITGEETVDRPSRWQLQWEVDQEADEILGGLLPPSPLKSSPPYDSPLKNQGRHEDEDMFKGLNFGEADAERHEQEDLDHLEPGWDLNDGFEWGPATEEIFQCDEDEESGREVLVYENEEGQTVMLPVEYLEDSLYDQIFGTADTPIGGSLPDLPGGQMSELKKGSLSYKLSRRSRGDRFVPPSRRPCSFFLEGNCRRSDCKFSHDLLTITCRFWEEGSCLKGDTCPFRHGFPLPSPPRSRRRNRSEGDQTSLVEPVSFASLKEGNGGAPAGGKGRPIPRTRNKGGGSVGSMGSFEIDSEADFPCLGSSVESKMDSLDEMSFPPHIKVTKVSKKKKKFVTVTKSMFKEVEADGGCQMKGTGGGRRARGGRCNSSDLLHLVGTGEESAVVGTEGGGPSSGSSAPCSSSSSSRKKKKEKGKDAHAKECESLRKVLRRRYPLPPHQPPFSHEDGTFSDF